MGKKKIYTERDLHEKMAYTEIMKFLFSIIVVGLSAAVVHKFKGMVQIAAACCLAIAVICMGSSIGGILLFDAGRNTLVRVLGGIVTILWLLACACISFAAVYSNRKYLAKRWLMPRKGFGGSSGGRGGKGKTNAAGELSSISWACAVFCLGNLIGCLMQWYYDYKARPAKKTRDPEAAPLDGGRPG